MTRRFKKRGESKGKAVVIQEIPSQGQILLAESAEMSIPPTIYAEPYKPKRVRVHFAERTTTWHGNGEPPKNRAEKIAAVKAWDGMPKDERPTLEDWLIENFGTDPATGSLLVPTQTFHGWRKLRPKS